MANVSTASFDGKVFPPDVTTQILSAGLEGAPFFSNLTPRPTTAGSVVFPTADPSGFGWVNELAEFPDLDASAAGAVFATYKIGGILLLSNEAIRDSQLNVTAELSRVIRGSLAAQVDSGVLYTDGTADPGAAPTGVVGALDTATGATLRAAAIDACGQIMAAGGSPSHAFLSPAMWQAEAERREDVGAGAGVLDDLGVNLTVVIVPGLHATDSLIVDTAGAFSIINTDSEILVSDTNDTAMRRDAVAFRVKSRVNVAIPVPAKTARALAVDGDLSA